MLWATTLALTVEEESRNWAIVAGVFAILATIAACWEVCLTRTEQKERRQRTARIEVQRKQLSELLTAGQALENDLLTDKKFTADEAKGKIDAWVSKAEGYINGSLGSVDAVIFLDTSDDPSERMTVGYTAEQSAWLNYLTGRLRRIGAILVQVQRSQEA